ncbi:MAG: DNA replication protein DnaC, partial [Oscillospiraceae bacterium]
MPSLNFKKAIDILSKKRQQEEYLASERFENVINEIPRIKQIMAELAQTNIKLSKVIFSKNTNEFNKIKSQNLLLQDEIKKLLFENNYPFDYLKPHYSCEKCNDTGYVEGKKC